MERRRVAGGSVLAIGLCGYVGGIYLPYPGRAFSLTAVMVGIALLVIAGGPAAEREP